MQYLHNFTSPSEIKPELTGVLFTPNKAIATDSFRLIETTHQFKNIKGTSIVKLPNAKKIKRITIETDGADAEIEQTNKKVKAQSIGTADDFPNYEMIKPADDDEPKATVRLNAKYVMEIARFIDRNGTDKFNRVEIEIRDNAPVVFKTVKDIHNNNGHDREIYGMIMPITE